MVMLGLRICNGLCVIEFQLIMDKFDLNFTFKKSDASKTSLIQTVNMTIDPSKRGARRIVSKLILPFKILC